MLIYADTRVIVRWSIPEGATDWHNPGQNMSEMLSVGVKINLGLCGDDDGQEVLQTKQVYPDGGSEVFDWKDVGILEDGRWTARADITETRCKINGVTYRVWWRARRSTAPEEERQIEVNLGLPEPVAVS